MGTGSLRLSSWRLAPGPQNSICDVPGVRVGHVTVHHDGDKTARTGVSVIVPDADFPHVHLPAAGFVFNGTGEMTGLHQVNEWGGLETPIALTGTSGVPQAMEGMLRHLLARTPELGDRQAPPLPLVSECNDMYLHDVRSYALTPEHVDEAIRTAAADQGSWGAVGAGTGMVSFGLKGGIGSASRRVSAGEMDGVVGAVCLVNFGQPGELVFGGLPVGHVAGEVYKPGQKDAAVPDGSLVAIIATDLPVSPTGLARLARRGPLALARAGSYGRHGSGDIFLAFSTFLPEPVQEGLVTSLALRQDALNDVFLATVEAVEEAILGALWACDGAYFGRSGRIVHALPKDSLTKQLFAAGLARRERRATLS